MSFQRIGTTKYDHNEFSFFLICNPEGSIQLVDYLKTLQNECIYRFDDSPLYPNLNLFAFFQKTSS